MELSLAPEAEKIIQDCIKTGEFATAEEVVTVALQRLLADGSARDFAPGEIEALLAGAQRSGPPVPYERAREEFRAVRKAFITGKK